MQEVVNYITCSLLNTWLYVTHSEYGDIQDLIDYLERKPHDTTPEQQRGLDFEDLVYKGEKPLYNEYVKDGLYQVKVKRPYKDIMLIGIIDVLQPNYIYDVKTTNRYEVGKYYHTSQHKVYPYCTGIKHFAYLINEECYKEDYTYQEGQCEELVDSFLDWLKQTNLYNVWKKNWIKTRKEIDENYG